MTDLALAVVLGGLLGAGLWSMLAALPRFSAPRLITRVAPYVRDVTDPAGRSLRIRTALDPASGITAGAQALWTRLRTTVARLLGGTVSLEQRFVRAGWRLSVEEYRGRQLAAALIAGAVGAALAGIAASRGTGGGVIVIAPVAAALAAWLAGDLLLTRAINTRRARIQDELPTVLDFLALCLSATETLPDAVRRTGEIGSGALAGELRRTMRAVNTGTRCSSRRSPKPPSVSACLPSRVPWIRSRRPLSAGRRLPRCCGIRPRTPRTRNVGGCWSRRARRRSRCCCPAQIRKGTFVLFALAWCGFFFLFSGKILDKAVGAVPPHLSRGE